MNNEQIAKGIGEAFATTFFEIIKDEKPKKFNWNSFFESNKEEVREKLFLYFINTPVEEEMNKLKDIAESAFKLACEKIKNENPNY